LDLTFAFRVLGLLGSERQIRSTSAAFDLEFLNMILPRVSQELQIGGTCHDAEYA
jgi:hypothetical protein